MNENAGALKVMAGTSPEPNRPQAAAVPPRVQVHLRPTVITAEESARRYTDRCRARRLGMKPT